jgi:lactate permease
MEPFTQILDPMNSAAGSTLAALIPVAVLLLLLAVFRISAWQAVIIGSAVTIILAVTIWDAPVSCRSASSPRCRLPGSG